MLWGRQALAGTLALAFSLGPFALFFTVAPEGRLVWHHATATISAPTVPQLSARAEAAIAGQAPSYVDGVAVLTYHGLADRSDWDGARDLSTDRFAEHLAALEVAGMNTITAREFVEACEGGRPLPPRAVLITFDDARARALLDADALLAHFDMRATVFVITEASGSGSLFYADWSQITKYARSGRWDVQSHTARSHHHHRTAEGNDLPALTSLADGETLATYAERVRHDLADAAAEIRARVGRAPVAFAYPFGAHGTERSNHDEIAQLLRAEVAEHAVIAFHQDEQASVPLARCDGDLLGLRRLDVKDWSAVQLITEITGMADRTEPGSR